MPESVTDDNGAFNIKCTIVNGILRVSAIGYETLFIDSCKGNIGTVRLRIDNQNLDEVVVKGYRQIVRHEHEKTIFNVSQMPKIEAMTAIDAMKFAPGVFVTSSGGISVLGKNAVVFVNDRRLTEDEQSAYLRNLRASDIERIEVMHNNGGDKDADIQGGVINIVTRQDRLDLIVMLIIAHHHQKSITMITHQQQTYSLALQNGMFMVHIRTHKTEVDNTMKPATITFLVVPRILVKEIIFLTRRAIITGLARYITF